jgi:LemA protein
MTAMQVMIALAAVLGFWAVGAYNRLVRLRNAIGMAWTALDEQLRRRGGVHEALLAALRPRVAGDPHALDAAAAAQRQVQSAADGLRARPVQEAGSASLVAAEGVLASAQARVVALLDESPGLRADADVHRMLDEWKELELRLQFARQAFNDAVEAYNGAARQFPTTLVAWAFGLRRAGRV